MAKRMISMLLVVCMLLGTCGLTAYAVDAGSTGTYGSIEEWEAALGAYTETGANAYTPSHAENLLEQSDSAHAYDPNADEEAVVSAEYVEGEILYARREGGSALSTMSTNSTADKLADLGIYDAEEIYTEQKSTGGVGLFSLGSSSETVWYKAKVTGDVLETVEALNSVSGIVAAEPNYIYTTEAVGQACEAECGNAWYLNCQPDDDHDRKGAHAKHGWHHVWEEKGEDFAPGTGAVVAVIDTGVDYTHKDLASSMWVNYAEYNGVAGVDDDGNGYIDDIYGMNATASNKTAAGGDPMDYNGHGTHVAGIIAMANNGEGGIGIAYGAKIMAIKAGQATGTFSSQDIAEAIQYAVAMGADVINMSFGGTGRSALVEAALEDAFATCVLVAAAGNDGVPTSDAPDEFIKKMDVYPAAYDFVLGVMSSDQNGKLASFSNWDYYANANAEYEMIAPGVDIYSTLPGDRYANWNGTSMAAPFVSAAAAVIRSCYEDKDEYNSRFIMGQLASATDDFVGYMDPIGKGHSYPKLNLYQSLTLLPQPNLTVSQVFALDNVGNGDENDGDRILDAGETIDLGIAIRNQWGKTGEVTIKADIVASGGMTNPYITFVNDTITLSPIGAFSSEDNGFVYEDSYLCDVSNPIRFTLSPDTPNDSELFVHLTVTTTNGWDKNDTAVYEDEITFTFRTQNGTAVRGHIKEDTVWTSDHYYIVENSLIIDAGATLTVMPGTQIQFWSSDYEDAYGGRTMAYLNNKGTLNMIGTEEQPIQCFPGAEFENYMVEILGAGVETLKYCKIVNARIGQSEGGSNGNLYRVELCDHCEFWQNGTNIRVRDLDSGVVKENTGAWANYGFDAGTVQYSVFHDFTGHSSSQTSRLIMIREEASNLYDRCSVTNIRPATTFNCKVVDNVYLPHKVFQNARDAGIYQATSSIPYANPECSDIFTYEGASSKYVIVKPYAYKFERDLMEALAAELGGGLLILNDEAEEQGVADGLWAYIEDGRPEGSAGVFYRDFYLDRFYDSSLGEWVWGDGSEYEPSSTTNMSTPLADYPYGALQIFSYPTRYQKNMSNSSTTYATGYRYVLEVPASLSDEEITAALTGFDYTSWRMESITPDFAHSAILNPILNTDTQQWFQFTAPSYTDEYYYSVAGNYWGTENDALINQMIQDDDDFAGALADIVEDPILTLEDDLSAIYPFVTRIWLTEQGGTAQVTEAAPGVTYEVHVTYNRDMDPDIQPMITYGGEEPFTDYTVHGDWVTAREWVGTTKISAVATGGTQIFRAKGGAAADDNWLVCGTDQYRFQFDIESVTAKSMVLNAVGGVDKVELQWIQNDYATLGGYNLYRSTKADSGFTKLNDSMLTETSYVDTDVEPGVTYYYYFTVVDTDGNEIAETRSNVAFATPLDNVRPVITHTPVAAAKVGQAVTVSATVTDNIGVSSVTLYYKVKGAASYTSAKMTYSDTTQRWTGSIPASAVTEAGVSYYLEAVDSTGNKAWSGTAEVPYVIVTDNMPTLLAVFPSTVNVGSLPETITVYGTNLTQGMTVTVGTVRIDTYTLKEDGTEITFATPDLPVGTYTIRVEADDKSAILKSALTYRDAGSYVQINSVSGSSGEELRVPIYVGVTGELTAFHLEMEIPQEHFSSVKVVKADGSAVTSSYKSSKLTVSMASAEDFNPGGQNPMLYLVLAPKAVSRETAVQFTLISGKLNGTETVAAPVNTSVTILPNFAMNVTVKYFKNSIPVSGVKITVANKTGTTDETGVAALTGITNADVVVRVTKVGYDDTAVEAFDAALILQYCAGVIETPLDASQLIAADVDGDGDVDEVDASLILKKFAGLIDFFPAGSWAFIPSSQRITLGSTAAEVTFTAVMVGDVDGSWGNQE